MQILLVGGDVAGEFLVQLRRAGLHRLVDGINGLQLLIFHLDLIHGLHGQIFAIGNNQSHSVTHIAHIFIQDVGMAGRGESIVDADALACDILPGHHAGNAVHGQCFAFIHADDAGKGIRRAQDFAVFHAGHLVVGHIHGLARYNVAAQNTMGLAADMAELLFHCLRSSFICSI